MRRKSMWEIRELLKLKRCPRLPWEAMGQRLRFNLHPLPHERNRPTNISQFIKAASQPEMGEKGEETMNPPGPF